MNSGWSTIYEIASKRHSTNNGKDHLTKNAFKVLEDFMLEEVNQSVRCKDHLTKNAFKVLEDFMLEEVNQSVRFSSGVVSWIK